VDCLKQTTKTLVIVVGTSRGQIKWAATKLCVNLDKLLCSLSFPCLLSLSLSGPVSFSLPLHIISLSLCLCIHVPLTRKDCDGF
jgi:hypothetical protein